MNTIFDSIRDPFCIFDRDYQIIRVNDAYAQMKNLPFKELLGKKCYEVLHNGTAVCDNCVVQKSLQSADPCAKDKLVTLPNGDKVWFEIYTYPILDEDGKVSHIIEYTRDITDRKKSEEDRRRKEELESRKSKAIELAVATFDALVAERGDSGKIWASMLKEAIKRR